MAPRMPVIDRFMSKVQLHENGECWEWSGGKDRKGYGKFSVESRMVPAHRWSYGYFIADIPEGLTIDHLCRATSCVNPYHMEPVTAGENAFRRFGGRCKNGHDLSDESHVYYYKGRRQCGTCMRARARGYRQRLRRECPEKVNAYEREWTRKNAERINARRRARRSGAAPLGESA